MFTKQIQTERAPHHRVYLPADQFRYEYKQFIKRNDWMRLAYRGLGSFYDVKNQIRYLNEDACEWFAIATTEPELMLPGEAARKTIKHYYHAGYTQSIKYNDTRIPAPIYFTGATKLDSAIYIDIKSCYCQMYKKLWLDTQFPSLTGSLPLRPVAEFFDDYSTKIAPSKFGKRARNAVTGILYSSRIMFYNGNEYFIKRIYGNLFNPLVWYSVNWMLHELANVAIGYGAIYIATDGYIFPSMSRWQLFSDLLDTLDLEFRCIAGKCRIVRFGGYSIRGYAIRDNEHSKTTNLYRQCLEQKLKLYTDDVINPRDKLVNRIVRKRIDVWNKPIDNIIPISNLEIVTKWSIM